MQVQINFGDIKSSEALADHVEKALDKELAHTADRITRIEVHLRDDKQKRRGHDDMRCTMEVRLAGKKPMAIETVASDIYVAVNECAAKLGRAVARKVNRAKP